MENLFFVLLLLPLVYTAIMLFFFWGFTQKESFLTTAPQTDVFVSVVIAARNEEENIRALFRSLQQQDYPSGLFEVILVNDHSTDATLTIARENSMGNTVLLSLPEGQVGKKAALRLGVARAKGQLLLFTDADCSFGAQWVSLFAYYYHTTKADLIAGPVLIDYKNTWGRLQALEFMSLVHSGAASIAAQSPIMLNGANLAVKREAYLKHQHQLKEQWQSGDDMFLLLALKKTHDRKITFLKNRKATVFTRPQKTITSFLAQRARWAGKATGYTDVWVLCVGAVVFLSNLLIAVSFLSFQWRLFMFSFILKSLADIALLFQAARFYNKPQLLWFFLPLQFIYPFYVLVSVFLAFLPVRWKGRKLKN